MMDNPQWQKEMKKLQNSKEFKESIKKTQDALKDPNTAARAEAKIETMVKVGQEQIKKASGNAMEEALAAMNDPAVMEQMQKMLKDPSFAKQLENMTKDPKFKNYVDAVR